MGSGHCFSPFKHKIYVESTNLSWRFQVVQSEAFTFKVLALSVDCSLHELPVCEVLVFLDKYVYFSLWGNLYVSKNQLALS